MTESSWQVMVPSSSSMALRRRTGRPGFVFGVSGFAATLCAEPNRLRVVRRHETIAVIEDIEDIGSDLSDNGTGTWVPAIIVTVAGEQLAFMPFERPGLLPHMVASLGPTVAAMRALVFGANG